MDKHVEWQLRYLNTTSGIDELEIQYKDEQDANDGKDSFRMFSPRNKIYYVKPVLVKESAPEIPPAAFRIPQQHWTTVAVPA